MRPKWERRFWTRLGYYGAGGVIHVHTHKCTQAPIHVHIQTLYLCTHPHSDRGTLVYSRTYAHRFRSGDGKEWGPAFEDILFLFLVTVPILSAQTKIGTMSHHNCLYVFSHFPKYRLRMRILKCGNFFLAIYSAL